MAKTIQAKNQSILDHGVSVRDRLFELIEFLKTGQEGKSEWRYPEWLFSYNKQIASNLLDEYTLDRYTVFHDMSKPYCCMIDENGKRHFPNHAEKSYELWKTISDDEQIGRLILRDMEIHTLKAEDIEKFCENKKEAISLLLTGLAEIHSNSEAFGGISSDSFKAKWKQIDRRGKAICKLLFGENK